MVQPGGGDKPHAAWLSGSPRLQPTTLPSADSRGASPQGRVRPASDRRPIAPSSAPPRAVATAPAEPEQPPTEPTEPTELTELADPNEGKLWLQLCVPGGYPLRLSIPGVSRENEAAHAIAAADVLPRPITAPESSASPRKGHGRGFRPASSQQQQQHSWRYWAADETRQGMDEDEMEKRRRLAEERRALQQLRPVSSRGGAHRELHEPKRESHGRLDTLAQPRWKLSARVQRPASHESPRDAVLGYPSARAGAHATTVEQPWPRHAERAALRSPRAASARSPRAASASPVAQRLNEAAARKQRQQAPAKPAIVEESAAAVRERALALTLAMRGVTPKGEPVWRSGNWPMVDDRRAPALAAPRPTTADAVSLGASQRRSAGERKAAAMGMGARSVFAGRLLGLGGGELLLSDLLPGQGD